MGKFSHEIQFGFIRDQVLYLDVLNYMWVTEIDYYKQHILDKCNQILGKKRIKNLKIRRADKQQLLSQKKEKEAQTQIKYTQQNFSDAIKNDIQEKQKKGFVLCSKCQKVYTQDKLCFFCA